MRSEGKIGLNGGLDMSDSLRSGAVSYRKIGGNVLGRSMQVRPTSSARRPAKMIALLLAIGVAIAVVSAMSVDPVEKAAQSNPAEMSRQPPGSPYNIAGRTYDALGQRLAGCTVVLTDQDTGTSSPPITSSSTGFYSTDLGSWAAWSPGDVITIHAEKGVMYGDNSSVVAGNALALNVTLDLMIPEFPAVALPIVGMVGLFIAANVISRRE